MRKYLLIILFVMCIASPSWGAVIWSDNFNAQADWTIAKTVYPCWAGCSVPTGWTGYYNSSYTFRADGYRGYCEAFYGQGHNLLYVSAYADTPHDTIPCRSGKCWTHWQESCETLPGFNQADGDLMVDTVTEYYDVYMRYYIRFPVGFSMPSGIMMKLYHAQHWTAEATPWAYFGADERNLPITSGGIVNWDGTLNMYIVGRCIEDYYCAPDISNFPISTLAAAAQPGGLFDGNWHYIEYRFKMNTGIDVTDGIYTGWVDGVQVGTNTTRKWNDKAGLELRGFRVFMIGGNNMSWVTTCPTMDACERWYAIDDVCISDSYIGDAVCGGAAPSVPNLTGVTISGGSIQ
jgi:hypothetical protein